MPELTVNVAGLAQLDQALSQLPEKIAKNIARSAARAGAKQIESEAERLVPRDTGKLSESIRITTSARDGVVKAFVKVGPGGKTHKGEFYARFVEFGTTTHYIKGPLYFGGSWHGSVKHPGGQKKPFMRPAFDAKALAAIDAFAEQLRKRLTKEGIEIPDPADDDDARD